MNVTILGAGNIGLGFVQRLYYEDSIAITVFSSKNIFENGNLIIKDIENESNIFLGNLVIVSNIDEDVNFTKEDIEDFLSPKQYEFIDSFSKTLLEK